MKPAEDLEWQVREELKNAINGYPRSLKHYKSLKNLSEIIGTEYGNRVLYELIQNAHDAHEPGDKGRIAIKLVIRSDDDGELYIANGGKGFQEKNVEAITSLATSDKGIGESIGNKGLGFRSIEALTHDVQIFSQKEMRKGNKKASRFSGYCFRFAFPHETEALLQSDDIDTKTRKKVAETIPRYLVPRPLRKQPKEIISYARRGYATVINAPLRTIEAVALACEQVQTLANLEVPLLLFLDRISEIRIDIEKPDQRPYRRHLRQRQKPLGDISRLPGSTLHEVSVGKDSRFLMVRYKVDKERVLDAVNSSIQSVPQLKRWLDWQGQPEVSVVVGLSADAVTKGRLYNFLPMGEEASAPLLGYLNAPFFTEIDRRYANLDLPLNEMLMEAAAEACAAATLSIVEGKLPVPPQAVFDLFAWTGKHAHKLDNALEEMGSALRDAPVIPVIAEKGSREWASLSQVSIWPKGHFAVLKDRDVAKHVGARLVSKDLDTRRVDRLEAVVHRTYYYQSLLPSGEQLANWSKEFAHSLLHRGSAKRTWSGFYNDLPQVFEASGANLEELDGKNILLDRSGKLRPAGGHDETSQSSVYVRRDFPKGKRKKAGVPFPPAALARRYRFLNEKVTLKRETLDVFIEAGLVREYDPVEALAGLKSALGKNANDQRWQEALLWAFQVSRSAGGRADEKLQEAELHVPTLSGWQPASHAMFSSSWSPIGKTLENYLVEAAEVSADCAAARDRMLVAQQDWPESVQDAKRNWVRFLELIGVADELLPIPAQMTREGLSAYSWNSTLRSGDPTEGLDEAWCAGVANISFNHPNTYEYQMLGEAWRLPGQIEHETLPESAREALCVLIFKNLEAYVTHYFSFEVGRFGRYENQWDRRELPTPLATFLRTKAWIAASTRDGMAFRRPGECWASRVRRRGPPRFVDRVPETVADFSESDEFAELAFGETLGLRDWQRQETAVARLCDLAGVATSLASSHRPAVREEYHRAWQDVVETSTSLPSNLDLIVMLHGQFEILRGTPEAPADVFVTEDVQRLEARMLSAAGKPVLEVGKIPLDRIETLLEETGAFIPRRLDGMGVQLLVDGEPFSPQPSDELLTSQDLDWLPEVIVIGHEILGEQLERGIQSSTIDRRIRAIRIRRCHTMTLVVDDKEMPPSEHFGWYAFKHETLPTLILNHSLSLGWMTLADELSSGLSRLIDNRLKSPKSFLSRLALFYRDRASDALESPSDEAIAYALECDIQTIRDHRAALRTGLERVLHLLVPVVAFYGGIELSQKLRRDVDQSGAGFDLHKWLQTHLKNTEYGPKKLIKTCEQVTDRAEMRRTLGLDYERFNNVLLVLGESPISSEEELRRLYEAHRAGLRPEIVERLRRHHAADFRKGSDLTKYVERKSLEFLTFNKEWVLTRETLESDLIRAHISALLNDTLGEEVSVKLPSLDGLVEANRKVVRKVAADALPILRVWCRQNNVSLPEPWPLDEAPAIAQYLENKGLLDFEKIEAESIPALCLRASCWPDGMPETLDEKALGLDRDTIEKEEKQNEREREKREIERRSIEFAGYPLDTGDPMFAGNLEEIATAWLAKDGSWLERSRKQPRLIELQNPDKSGSGSSTEGKGGGKRPRNRRLSDTERQAMGLASEWLAYQFLRQRHGNFVDDTCWISENRAQFFGGDEGDDSAGYDFRIKTPQANWWYEVKSSLEDSGEFELTANEIRVASSASKDGSRRYRILYVPYVFSPEKWCVFELPNPMGEKTSNRFKMIRSGSVRFQFKRR